MRSISKKSISPAQGVKDHARTKARDRRERQKEDCENERYELPPRNDLRPKLRSEDWPIGSLMRPTRHVRRVTKAQIGRVKRSLGENGFINPIVVDVHGNILDGVTRWRAAIEMGSTTVPVIVVEHLSAAKLAKLAITLNRIGELGEWDIDNLKIAFEELIELDEDMTITGFTDPEIDLLIFAEADEDAADETAKTGNDSLPPLAEKAVSVLSDLWHLRQHRLLCGDSCDPGSYQRLLRRELAQLLLTDQPYNIPIANFVTTRRHREFAQASGEMSPEEFADFTETWMAAALTFLRDGGLLGTFIDWRGVSTVLSAGDLLGLKLLNIIVWSKSNAGLGSLWRSQHELLPIFKFKDAPHVNNVGLGRNGRWRSNVWQYPGGGGTGIGDREAGREHPTPKNREMIEDAILDVTSRGDLVLDPFVGSGTTLIAAETTGRACRAIEIDGLYCDLAIRRWQTFTGDQAVLAETGETFAEVARRRIPKRQLLLPAPIGAAQNPSKE